MLMLQRTSEKEISNAKCNDPVTVLACTMGTTSCPAECKKTVNTGDVVNTGTDVKAGNLELDVQKVSNGVISVPANGVISMGDVKLAANGADITLRGVTLERIGLGNNTSVKGVWFEKNGVRVTNKGYLSSDSRTSVSFNPALVVKSTDTLGLVVELKGDTGAEHAFKITGVESSAANLNVKNNTTVTVRTTDYKVASVNVAYKNSSREYNMEENKSYELAKINIENVSNVNQKSVVVKSMLLRNEKNGDVNNLYDVVLYRNGKKVSDKVEMVGSRELLITLKDTITSAQTANYSLEAKVKGVDSADGDTYLFDLRRGEDMTAVEDSTNFRSAVSLGSLDTNKFYTIKGGKILFATANNLPRTETVAAESSDVVLMKGTINPKEPVILRDLKLGLTYNGGLLPSSISKIQAKIWNTVINGSFTQDNSDSRAKEVRLLQCIRSETVGASKPLADLKTTCDRDNLIDVTAGHEKIASFDQAGNFTVTAVTFAEADLMLRKAEAKTNTYSATTVFFDGDFYVSGKSDVQVLVSFNSKAIKNQGVRIDNLKLTSFKKGEYQKSQNNIENNGDYQMKGGNGFVAGRTITIGDAKINLTKTSSLSNPKIVNGSSTETVVYEGVLRNGGVDTLTINDINVAFANNPHNADKVGGSVSVKIGEQTFGPEDLKIDTTTTHATTGSFGNVGFTLEPGKSYPIKVSYLVNAIDPFPATVKFTPMLNIKVSDRQGNSSNAIENRNLGEVTVTQTADIQFGASTLSVKNSLIKTNQEQTIARFSMTNKNAETFINKIQATFAVGQIPSQVEVKVFEGNDPNNVVFDQTVAPTSNVATIEANSSAIKPNTRYTVEVLASFAAAGTKNLSSFKIGFDGSSTLTDAGQNWTVNVVSTLPQITVVKNANADDLLTFDIEANGDDNLAFELAAANITVAGFDATTWQNATVLVDGTEVNAGVAAKQIAVPANSKVRVTIQRGTMNFAGSVTKGVLRVMSLKATAPASLTAINGGVLNSSNASNIVSISSSDGTKVIGDWSKLRGEFSI